MSTEYSREQFTSVCYNDNEFSMFLLLRHILNYHINDFNNGDFEFDWQLFCQLKDIITDLVIFKPESRMKLEDARQKLQKLEELKNSKRFEKINGFTLLDPSLQTLLHEDPTMAVESTPTQNTYPLADIIRATRIFTSSSTENELHLTQRNTNLCVSFAAMKLLCFALIEFIERNNNGDKKSLAELVKFIPEDRSSPKINPEDRFIAELLTICCNVISPRSLIGLNHCHLDDQIQISRQEQNIRKSNPGNGISKVSVVVFPVKNSYFIIGFDS